MAVSLFLLLQWSNLWQFLTCLCRYQYLKDIWCANGLFYPFPILKIWSRKFTLFTESSVLPFTFAQWTFTECSVFIAFFYLPSTELGSWRNQNNWNTNTSLHVSENTDRDTKKCQYETKKKYWKQLILKGLHCEVTCGLLGCKHFKPIDWWWSTSFFIVSGTFFNVLGMFSFSPHDGYSIKRFMFVFENWL